MVRGELCYSRDCIHLIPSPSPRQLTYPGWGQEDIENAARHFEHLPYGADTHFIDWGTGEDYVMGTFKGARGCAAKTADEAGLPFFWWSL